MIFKTSVAATMMLLSAAACLQADDASREKQFVATPLTKPKEFTPGIEGPACDAKGFLYAVNFKEQRTIGRVSPQGKGEVYVRLPGKSTGNGIRFDRQGFMYVADYVGHNILKVDPKTRKVSRLILSANALRDARLP